MSESFWILEVLVILDLVRRRHSRHGDAGLSDHLGAQVFGGQLEGPVQQPQMLVEAVVAGRARHEQRADFLHLRR